MLLSDRCVIKKLKKILEFICKQVIINSDIKIKKGSVSALMCFFQLKFFWTSIL